MSKKLTQSEFVNRSNIIHDFVYDYSDVCYKNSRTNVKIICPVHGEFSQRPHEHMSGQGCPVCRYIKSSQKNTSNTTQFVNNANKIYNNIYDYSNTNYIKSSIKVKINCKHHGEFIQTPNHHLRGHGCSKCGIQQGNKIRSRDIKYFIKKSNSIHKNLYDYSKVKYVNGRTKVEIICNKHGEFFQSPDNHINGSGCPKCNFSKGEIKIKNWLDKHTLQYESQKTFNSCRNPKTNYLLPFDFYIPSKNLIIEYDGIQHFEKIFKSDLKSIQYRDKIKNQYCSKNNITLLRIPYTKMKIVDKILTKGVYK